MDALIRNRGSPIIDVTILTRYTLLKVRRKPEKYKRLSKQKLDVRCLNDSMR